MECEKLILQGTITLPPPVNAPKSPGATVYVSVAMLLPTTTLVVSPGKSIAVERLALWLELSLSQEESMMPESRQKREFVRRPLDAVSLHLTEMLFSMPSVESNCEMDRGDLGTFVELVESETVCTPAPVLPSNRSVLMENESLSSTVRVAAAADVQVSAIATKNEYVSFIKTIPFIKSCIRSEFPAAHKLWAAFEVSFQDQLTLGKGP